jgi:SAM-dependent methyltransferase
MTDTPQEHPRQITDTPLDKYSDEWQWWERYLHEQIIPWNLGQKSVQWFVPIPPREPPGSDDPGEAALAFRRVTNRFLFETSWRIDPALDYGMILDVGCGPFIQSADLKSKCYAVDPNLNEYQRMGYPVHQYGAVLIPHSIEGLTYMPDEMFDTILSNNALNHVDDFEQAIAQMERLAKPDSFWRVETHYREATLAEPELLDDDRVLAAFRRFRPTKLYERHWEGVIASVGWTIGEPPC